MTALFSGSSPDPDQFLNSSDVVRDGVCAGEEFSDQSREALTLGGFIGQGADFVKVLPECVSSSAVNCLSHWHKIITQFGNRLKAISAKRARGRVKPP